MMKWLNMRIKKIKLMIELENKRLKKSLKDLKDRENKI
jgi:hypothetical protein